MTPENQTYQEVLRDAQKLAAEFARSYPARDREGRFPSKEVALLKESGLLAAPVPDEYGGRGLPLSYIVRVVITLATGNPSIAQLYGLHSNTMQVIADLSLARKELKKRLFDEVVKNHAYIANASSEKNSRDLWALETAFVPTPDGKGIRVSGEKFFCTGSLASEFIKVLGVLNGPFAYAFVPKDAPGMEILDDWDAMGQRGTSSGTVRFKDVYVPWDMVVSLSERGQKHVAPTFQGPMSQVNFSAALTGIAKGALEAGVQYVKSKTRPFPGSGPKLSSAVEDPYILKHAGRMYARVMAAETSVLAAALLAEKAMAARGSEEELARLRGESMVAVAKAKVMATRAALQVPQEIFQMCGTRAALGSENMDRFWRDARTLSLHDPVDYKARLIGEYYLQDRLPSPGVLS